MCNIILIEILKNIIGFFSQEKMGEKSNLQGRFHVVAAYNFDGVTH